MMIDAAAPAPIRLLDYQPTDYATTQTELEFDIYDGETVVICTQQVQRREGSEASANLLLHGQDLRLDSVAVDGRALHDNEYRLDAETLTLFDVPQRASVRVVTRIRPEQNTALEGLYKSGGMYCTQCEAEGFRKITYYQDRPDVLARFTTHIVADAEHYPVMLANGNKVADEILVNGRRRVTWEDPFPKPSYLFALVAGDLACIEDTFVTRSGRSVALEIYSEPHNIDQCGYAMDALKRSMRWDEEVYGREYDLDIFMIVAVDDFNMGAMENKGLNIFNTSCVLATPDTATDAAYQRVEGVVAHEYFHNWSGNRVTCRDWFQLSLKEGFTVFRDAQFSSDMNGATAKRIEDVSLLRSVQFAEDAGPLAHPIRPDAYIEISNFYTSTVYEKGAEVVGMLHTLLGAERFRRGSDLYFERFDGQAATTEDFVAAMEEANSVNLAQFRLWYSQAGTPVINVASKFGNNTLTLQLNQETPDTPKQSNKQPMHVPVTLGLLDPQGQAIRFQPGQIDGSATVELRQDDRSLLVHLQRVTDEVRISGLAAPPEVSFLRGFSAPVRVNYPRSPQSLEFLARHDEDGFARWDALQTLVVDQLFELVAKQRSPVASDSGGVATGTVALFGDLISEALDCKPSAEPLSLLANMLTVPSENYLFEQASRVDVHGIVSTRDEILQRLANALQPQWLALYQAHQDQGGYEPTPTAMASRQLKNLSLQYLCTATDPEPQRVARTCALQQLQQADNLTDRRGALAAIINSDLFSQEERGELFTEFYERWHNEALVVNLWLQLQASAPGTNARAVEALEGHPGFDARNPNKVRSLIGAFAQHNARNFHKADGGGYTYLATKITGLDQANPQLAARLALPLSKWRRFVPAQSVPMREALQGLSDAGNLSKDVFEIVSKSLAD
ncbi:MAG: aminopeptidase N [Pseudomonadales bacterium]